VRILLDTNVLVSALLSADGAPGRVLDAIRRNRHTLVSSLYLTEELRSVCSRKHLRDRVFQEQVDALVYNMETIGIVVTDLPAIDLSPDPKDNPILATALAGGADLIVSGDKNHMLNLGHVQGIPILSPREALERLNAAG
jgi:uncharacterized protein